MKTKWLSVMIVGLILLLAIQLPACSTAPPPVPAPIPVPAPLPAPEPEPPAPPTPAPSPPAQPEPPPEPKNPRYIYENGAIHVGGDEEPIELINNPNATNPTYAELIAFIKADFTDTHDYLEGGAGGYVCANFAEDVHNNAEAAGIRAAWVGIDFEEDDKGHALNAFETTDRGLVYIDCTGEGRLTYAEAIERFGRAALSKPTPWDTVAYIEIGNQYGRIVIAKAKTLSYSFYEEYTQKWQEYKEMLSDYNEEVIQFNQEVNELEKLLNDYNDEVAEYNREYSEYKRLMALGGPWREAAEVIRFKFLMQGRRWGEAEREYLEEQGLALKEWAEELEAWETRLGEKDQVIDELAEELGNFWFEPLGIVKDFHIHWGNS